MSSSRYPFIAREAWLFLSVLAGMLGVLAYYLSAGVVFVLAFIFFLFLFRDPKRTIPSVPLAIVSPAYGTVVGIDEASSDPWVNRQAKKISIKISRFDIYSWRSPIEGKLMEQWSKLYPEEKVRRKLAFWIRTDEGDDVVVVFNLGFFSLACFKIYVQSGERLGQGQRCGYLYFGGIVVDVYIPMNSRCHIEADQVIISGEDILACLVHQDAASVVNDNNPHGKVTAGGIA